MCADEENTGRILDDIGITNELSNINVPTKEKIITQTKEPILVSSSGTKTTVFNIVYN